MATHRLLSFPPTFFSFLSFCTCSFLLSLYFLLSIRTCREVCFQVKKKKMPGCVLGQPCSSPVNDRGHCCFWSRRVKPLLRAWPVFQPAELPAPHSSPHTVPLPKKAASTDSLSFYISCPVCKALFSKAIIQQQLIFCFFLVSTGFSD